MEQMQDFKSLQEQVQASLISITRTTGQLSAEDLGFHRSFNSEVGTALDEQSERVLTLARALLESAASISELKAPFLEDADDVENDWRNVVDVVDSLLEKSDTCLDEYTGMIKRKGTPSTDLSTQVGPITCLSLLKPSAYDSKIPSRFKKQTPGNLYRNQNLVKPQLGFEVKPNNDDDSTWKPILTSKPHGIVSLEESLGTFTNEFGQIQHCHPYEHEILHLKYPDHIFQKADPIQYLPVESTSAIFVDTEEGVLEMLEELKAASEIAIDLEHHDQRSYVGMVSLMQISTRDKDWIVDTLKPWRQNLQVLNEVFADPKIIKVFHGAYMDIVWLQRDLGLYVVGLFDTHHASRALKYAGASLAFLLKKFVDFDAEKQYQMADWRIRPLPDEMFYYARADTHFLLYIFDMIRNELIDKSDPKVPDENYLETTLQKSKETSLLRYERQVYNSESGKGPGGWFTQLNKTPSLLSKEQFAVFRTVHEWRDYIARLDDDSPTFVMPQHVVLTLAKLMPGDMVTLLGLTKSCAYSVKSRAVELLNIIKSAKASGKDGPSMIDILRSESSTLAAKTNPKRAPTTALEAASTTLVAVMDEGDLRSSKSTFWGGAFGSSMWDTPDSPHKVNKNDNLRLAVPLPPLSSEIFGAPQGFAEQAQVAQKIPLPDSPVPPPLKVDEPFVLKRGAKRKSEATSDIEETGGDGGFDIALDVEDDEAEVKAAAKALRKAEKRARKAAKRAAEAGKSGELAEDEEDNDDEPFDYSKAESVLHGKKELGDRSGKLKKPFDPYVKSMDAPKGMRRVQTERAGKSQTFKN
ncbi:unnamed protein product [Diplocarpon coronariae]